MKYTVKFKPYQPKPAKKTIKAAMRKYLAITANERSRK